MKIEPLTIFTGANSAGKSTIIQSMLLTAQTMQSPVHGRPVVLNGHMSRLGSFTDLVSGGDDDLEISVEFELSPTARASANPRIASTTPFLSRRAGALEQVSVKYSFSSRPGPNDQEGEDLLLLQPILVDSFVEVAFLQEDKLQRESLHVRRAGESIHARLTDLKLDQSAFDPSELEALRYSVVKGPRKGFAARLDHVGVRTDAVGATLMHFLPRTIAVRYDQVSAEVRSQLTSIFEPNSYRARSVQYPNRPIAKKAADFIVGLLRDTLSQNEESTGRHGLSSLGKRTVDQKLQIFERSGDFSVLQTIYRGLPGRDVSFLFTVLEKERETIENLLTDGRAPSLALQMIPPSDSLQMGMDFVHYYFLRRVKYLGPLRDEPKPVYPLAGSSDPADVGFRGEHTAAVLHVHKSTLVNYFPSTAFEGEGALFEPCSKPLAVAVQDWLAYMGVGKVLETSDLGKLGHELKIVAEGSDLRHDLTQVGVGVSQVLPILVLALLADEGSTLIFEQPELHLHPRVQSRLADFFVSMIKLGKQCIVETHSEYLINRLRYLAAADFEDEVARSAAVYFVTKNAERSCYQRITLDDLGGFDSWPEGFFDESERATSKLLRESLKKRRARRGVSS